jgi:hypothetical protein
MKNSYRVFYHQGQEIGIRTHVSKGTAWVDSSGLHIHGPGGTSFVPAADIKEVELFRLHGSMRVIRVDYQGGRLFLAVIRFMIGQFALVNFFKTGALHRTLAGLATSS